MPPLLSRLTKSRNELAHHLDAHIVELGLSANELLVMYASLDAARPTAAHIRRHLGIHQSTFTSLVARLIARGYVKVEPCRFDHRTRYLNLTPPGFTAVVIARGIQLELEAAARPYDADAIHNGLGRLASLTQILPWPRRSQDGLPDITA